jgi:hypothetical protein
MSVGICIKRYDKCVENVRYYFVRLHSLLSQPYLIALEHPGLQDQRFQTMLRELMKAIDRLPTANKAMFVDWIRFAAGSDRYRQYIETFRQYATLR